MRDESVEESDNLPLLMFSPRKSLSLDSLRRTILSQGYS